MGQAPPAPRGRSPRVDSLRPMPQLSKEALARLTAEYEDLTTRGRIEVAQKIEVARLLGDLSENGDYHAAKDEQGHMEGRIRHLEHLIENAEVIETVEHGKAGPGAIVTVLYDGDPPEFAERYLLGHMEERTGGIDLVSPTSPLGTALIGREEGDMVEYQAPSGTLRVQLVKVEHPG
jgi:transcription elongation factor GreA